MKFFTFWKLLLLLFGFSFLYAESNHVTKMTPSSPLNKAVNYEQKLKEAIDGLNADLKKSHNENNVTLASDYNKVGFYYNKIGQTDKALKYYLKAVAIIDRQTKPYMLQRTIYYNNAGTAYEKLNNLPEALNYYMKALKVYQEKLPHNHPYIAGTMSDIGNVYEKMGKKEKALEYQLEALNIRKSSLPLNHPDTAYSYSKVASMYEAFGDYANALKYGKQLMEILDKNDIDTRKALQRKLDMLQKKIDSLKKNEK